MNEEMNVMAAPDTTGTPIQVIGEKQLAKAQEILTKYKAGKAPLEKRIVEDEMWYELRHWETLRRDKNSVQPAPTSAWLHNTLVGKHSDAMDNVPEPLVLPREESDRESAKVLSQVLPVVLERNGFEETYDKNWWEKVKHGVAVYGTFWNPELENGLGDVEIRPVDILSVFWEPGITDIEDSKHLFIAGLTDEETMDAKYPQYKGKFKGGSIEIPKYNYDDTVDTEDKVIVWDWYYKKLSESGRIVTHRVQFVNDILLYASENDPQYAKEGWYEHGKYPVDFDILFPLKGTPVGVGMIGICKDPQLYIDKLGANIMENAMMGTKKRFFVSSTSNVNKEQFKNWNEPLVECEGEIDDSRIREITVRPLDAIYLNAMNQKIEEMKDTAFNRDVNSGGAPGSGVTAAAAVAALQEAGNRQSRSMLKSSFRRYGKIYDKITELMRQFYTECRSFRVVAPDMDDYTFVLFSNEAIREQQTGIDSNGNPLFRRPVFDIKISAQKKNPFSRMEQNERAKELYGMGFFQPENAQAAMGALEMMDFEGIEKVKTYVQQGQTLFNLLQQMSQQLTMLTGMQMGATLGGQPNAPAQESTGGNEASDEVMEASTPKSSYTERLVKRSKPDMEAAV